MIDITGKGLAGLARGVAMFNAGFGDYRCSVCSRPMAEDDAFMCEDCDSELCEDCAEQEGMDGDVLCQRCMRARGEKKNSSLKDASGLERGRKLFSNGAGSDFCTECENKAGKDLRKVLAMGVFTRDGEAHYMANRPTNDGHVLALCGKGGQLGVTAELANDRRNADGSECPVCHGEGEIDAPKTGEKMPATGTVECARCHGLGRLENKNADHKCSGCGGKAAKAASPLDACEGCGLRFCADCLEGGRCSPCRRDRQNSGVHGGKTCPKCKKGKLLDLGDSLYSCDKCGEEIYANEMRKVGRGVEMKENNRQNADMPPRCPDGHGPMNLIGAVEGGYRWECPTCKTRVLDNAAAVKCQGCGRDISGKGEQWDSYGTGRMWCSACDGTKAADFAAGMENANAIKENYGAGWDRSTVEVELSKSQEKLSKLSTGLARARDAVKDASRQSDPEAIRDAKDALNRATSEWDTESRVLDGIKRELASAPRKNAGVVHFTFGEGENTQAACGAAVAFGSRHAPLRDVTCKACLEDLSGEKQNASGLRRGISKYGSKQEGGK